MQKDIQYQRLDVQAEQVNSQSIKGTFLEKPTKPDASIVMILIAGIGGMLAFFGLSFGLVAAVADSGFLIVCLVACAISLTLFILAYVARRRQLTEWRW